MPAETLRGLINELRHVMGEAEGGGSWYEELIRRAEEFSEKIEERGYLPAYDDDDYDRDHFEGLVEELVDAINTFAPVVKPFWRFEIVGAVWNMPVFSWVPDVYSASEDESVLKVDELPSYILHINERGNATLFEVTLKEVWSVV